MSVRLLVLAASLAGCDRSPAPPADVIAPPPPADVIARDDRRPRVVVLGDSLTAGLGLPVEASYPAQLQRLATAAGYGVEIVGRGVSGETTAGGLRRLAWILDRDAADADVAVVVVALGGNDGLRGLPVGQMRDNLDTILTQVRRRGLAVVLAGMEAPPNFGPEYTSRFRDVFRTLAERHDAAFVPFLLEGVAGVSDLNQDDGIHPNAAGARRVAEHLWPVLEPLLAGATPDDRVTP